jgi:hypothetical protein
MDAGLSRAQGVRAKHQRSGELGLIVASQAP